MSRYDRLCALSGSRRVRYHCSSQRKRLFAPLSAVAPRFSVVEALLRGRPRLQALIAPLLLPSLKDDETTRSGAEAGPDPLPCMAVKEGHR